MATRCVENTKYYRIEEDIKRQIQSGELRPGDRVMSEAEICRQYDVSRISAKRALDDLVWKGYIHRVSGSGSYVAEQRPQGRRLGLCEEILSRGMRPASRLVSFCVLRPEEDTLPDELHESLVLTGGDTVYYFRRLRYADGEVIALDDAYIPGRHCPGLTAQELAHPSASVHRLVEQRFGYVPDHAVETCQAISLTEEQAALLGMEPGEAALRVRRLSYRGAEVLGCFTRIYRGEAYEYRVDL